MLGTSFRSKFATATGIGVNAAVGKENGINLGLLFQEFKSGRLHIVRIGSHTDETNVRTIESQVALAQGVKLFHQYYHTEDATHGNGQLCPRADASEKVVMAECSHARDNTLQGLAAEVPDEWQGEEQRRTHHHRHVKEAFALDVAQLFGECGQRPEPAKRQLQCTVAEEHGDEEQQTVLREELYHQVASRGTEYCAQGYLALADEEAVDEHGQVVEQATEDEHPTRDGKQVDVVQFHRDVGFVPLICLAHLVQPNQVKLLPVQPLKSSSLCVDNRNGGPVQPGVYGIGIDFWEELEEVVRGPSCVALRSRP